MELANAMGEEFLEDFDEEAEGEGDGDEGEIVEFGEAEFGEQHKYEKGDEMSEHPRFLFANA